MGTITITHISDHKCSYQRQSLLISAQVPAPVCCYPLTNNLRPSLIAASIDSPITWGNPSYYHQPLLLSAGIGSHRPKVAQTDRNWRKLAE